MKRPGFLSLIVPIYCLLAATAAAQKVTYLDENYNPATSEDYVYKRVIKYQRELINASKGYYDNWIFKPTGIHFCSVTDYYSSGEVALVGTRISGDLACSILGGFEGQVVAYYRNGNFKRREPWAYGKLNGTVVYYDEGGNETSREEYVRGSHIEQRKFWAPADSPLIGTWTFVEYFNNTANSRVRPVVKRSIVVTYMQNGVVEVTFRQGSLKEQKEKRNWMYTSENNRSGVEEDYLGDELVERDKIRWLNPNQFECTVTYHQNSNAIGDRLIFTRQ